MRELPKTERVSFEVRWCGHVQCWASRKPQMSGGQVVVRYDGILYPLRGGEREPHYIECSEAMGTY